MEHIAKWLCGNIKWRITIYDWLRVAFRSRVGTDFMKVWITGDIYGDHAVSCAGIVGIKHRHNVVRDTLVDICYRSGISSGKEVNIVLSGGTLINSTSADVLLYSVGWWK
ncbi:hypothetical protein Tco_1097457 [Tanacetum coccineum]